MKASPRDRGGLFGFFAELETANVNSYTQKHDEMPFYQDEMKILYGAAS
jgi:hypothetical protein